MIIDNIKEEIQKAEDIVILTHESPDGDAVGSALAMYLTLKNLYDKHFCGLNKNKFDLDRELKKEIVLSFKKNKINIPYKQVVVHNGKRV